MGALKNIISALFFLLFYSCTIGHSGAKLEKQGIYECKSLVNESAPIFKFNSYSDSTIIYLGTENYFEFYDLNSKQFVRLYQDSYNYNCDCVIEL